MLQDVGALGWAGWVPALLFWVVWLGCIVHCLRKRAFYPVFATTRATRIFWLVSFLFLSPILLLWYVIFGGVMPANRKPARWRSALVVFPALLIAVLSLASFLPQFRHTVITERDPETGALATPGATGINVHLGVQRNSMSTASSMGTSYGGDHNTWTFSSVWIQEVDDHPLLRETARALHKSLATDRRVMRVGWGPPGETPPTGERAYDFYILLSVPDIDLIGLPGRRSARGTLAAEVGMMPYPGNHSVHEAFEPPLIICNGNIKIQFDSVHTGLETSGAHYARPGADIGENIYEQVRKAMDGLSEKHGAATEFPDFLYGPMVETPALPFPADAEVTQFMSAYGLLNHNHTVWTLTSNADPADFVTRAHLALEGAGWQGELELREGTSEYLRMHKDEDVFWIEREVVYPLNPAEAPVEGASVRYFAHYIDRFGADAYPALLERLLASNSSENLLLAFRSQFIRYGFEEAFYKHFTERAFAGVDAAMVMARHFQDEEQPEQAIAMARNAEVLSWFEPDGNKPNKKTLETLLEDLGLAPLDKLQVEEGILRGLGTVFPEEEGNPIVREVAVSQPVIFRPAGAKGLWGVKVQPVDGTDEWQYVVVQLAPGTSWETSKFIPPAEGPQLKHWRQSMMFGEGVFADISVDRTDDGRLRYTFERGVS